MKIIVIGGTGGFGSAICRLLHEDGHEVVAASRSRPTDMPQGIAHAVLDRRLATARDLTGHDVVVDAAGPFQDQSLSLAEAAIAARVHYLDISDDRTFVTAVGTLDAAAKAAGVALVSGASSIPALSSAAALRTAAGLTSTERVDVSISAGADAVFGPSVLSAMLHGAGRPVPWNRRGGPMPIAMTGPRRIRMPSDRGDLERQVIVCDSPDLETMPAMMAGRPEVRFRAGSELTVHNLAMRIAAFATSKGMIRSASVLAPLADVARRLTAFRGSGRSGMLVETIGRKGDVPFLRRWSLVVENGQGPTVPALVVPALVGLIGAHGLRPGARSAAGILKTWDILARLDPSDYGVVERDDILRPLYAAALEHGWERCSPAVRRMHDVVTSASASGIASVQRGPSLLAELVCRIIGFPEASPAVPVTVSFEVDDGVETWTRRFGSAGFTSRLRAIPGGVEERFGMLRFRFRLHIDRSGSLSMIPAGWRLGRLPLPAFLQPDGVARETQDNQGRFSFDVPIRAPIVGDIVHYRGHLTTDASNDATDPARRQSATVLPFKNRGGDRDDRRRQDHPANP